MYGTIFLALFSIGALFYFLNPAVKIIASSFLSNTLYTNVSIAKLDINIFDLNMQANTVEIDNLEGFEGNIIEVENIILKVKDISNELIIVNELSVDGVVLMIAQQGNKINLYQWYQKLNNHRQTLQTNQTNTNPSDTSKQPVVQNKIIVKSLNLRNIKLIIKGEEFNRQANLADITLSDFGQDKGGILISHIPTELVGLLTNNAKEMMVKHIGNVSKKSVLKKVKQKISHFKDPFKKIGL